MTELRHVMGLLTMDGDGPTRPATTDLAPQPGLDRLDALVERVRDAGVPVESPSPAPGPLPPGIDLTAYRVVQEALTNTVKHAAGATATVARRVRRRDLRVEVTDTGGDAGRRRHRHRPRAARAARAARVYGGTLQAGHGSRRVPGRAPEIPLWRRA